MNLDIWLVFVWPIIVFIAGTAIVGFIRWGWTRFREFVRKALAPGRERRRVARSEKESLKRIARAVKNPTTENRARLTPREQRTFMEELREVDPAKAGELTRAMLRRLMRRDDDTPANGE